MTTATGFPRVATAAQAKTPHTSGVDLIGVGIAMKTYRYKSPIGTFIIKLQADGRWGLWFKDDLLGSYDSEVAAADDVYVQSTGDNDWDSFKAADIPTDIYEWEVVAS